MCTVTFVTFNPDRVALGSLKPYSQERCLGLNYKVHDRTAQPAFAKASAGLRPVFNDVLLL